MPIVFYNEKLYKLCFCFFLQFCFFTDAKDQNYIRNCFNDGPSNTYLSD